MNDTISITILGEEVRVTSGICSIHDLKYFEENPRVFSCIHGEEKPTDEDELQKFIEKTMWKQSSVKNLIPDIKTQGGLHEPILVRYETKQVIEGNSRLAAFRHLYEETKDEKWATIPCNFVSKLTDEQQDAYLSQMHIKGKTPWAAYEKANFSYIREKRGLTIKEIARVTSETPGKIEKQIAAVRMMENNKDKEKSHFSYYDVLVKTRDIYQSVNYKDDVVEFVLSKIRNISSEDSHDIDFTAQELRIKLPIVLKKSKELKKFTSKKSTLDEAYQNARPSNPQQKVKIARAKIQDISRTEVSKLKKQDANALNALLADVNRLIRDVKRIQKMVEAIKKEKQDNA